MSKTRKRVASARSKKKRMPREYGVGCFLSWLHSDGGMRRAVRRVAYEDRQMKLFESLKNSGQVIH